MAITTPESRPSSIHNPANTAQGATLPDSSPAPSLLDAQPSLEVDPRVVKNIVTHLPSPLDAQPSLGVDPKVARSIFSRLLKPVGIPLATIVIGVGGFGILKGTGVIGGSPDSPARPPAATAPSSPGQAPTEGSTPTVNPDELSIPEVCQWFTPEKACLEQAAHPFYDATTKTGDRDPKVVVVTQTRTRDQSTGSLLSVNIPYEGYHLGHLETAGGLNIPSTNSPIVANKIFIAVVCEKKTYSERGACAKNGTDVYVGAG